jgi:hypothetical protein
LRVDALRGVVLRGGRSCLLAVCEHPGAVVLVGIAIDITLSGKLRDLKHYGIGEYPECAGVFGVAVLMGPHRSTKPHADRESWLHFERIGRLNDERSFVPNGNNGSVATNSEAGCAGATLVEKLAPRACALRVDQKQAAPIEHPGSGVERGLGGVAT